MHGALCVSYSGQCFSSEAWGGRSANRGQCAQVSRPAKSRETPEFDHVPSACNALDCCLRLVCAL